MTLVCKKCGYKQRDASTIAWLKKRFPHIAVHDIPYYCGACMDNATNEEYLSMEQYMNRRREENE